MSNSRNGFYNRKSYRKEPVSPEAMAKFLKEVVAKVKTEEDPIVLNQYRAAFKKNVPLTLRMYVAGYLASQSASRFSRDPKFSRDNRDFKDNRDSRENREPRENFENRDNRRNFAFSETFENKQEKTDANFENREERPRAPRVVIPEEEAATIFISVGKYRNATPKDFVRMIIQDCGLARERIGSIRILDKYSFVTVYSEDADKIIECLNGKKFHGRIMEVSYSNSKKQSLENGESGDESSEQLSQTDTSSDEICVENSSADNSTENTFASGIGTSETAASEESAEEGTSQDL